MLTLPEPAVLKTTLAAPTAPSAVQHSSSSLGSQSPFLGIQVLTFRGQNPPNPTLKLPPLTTEPLHECGPGPGAQGAQGVPLAGWRWGQLLGEDHVPGHSRRVGLGLTRDVCHAAHVVAHRPQG